MAAGDSPTSICNIALAAIGEDPIASVSPPDAKKRAILCNTLYEPTRHAILAAAPWRCARRQANLPAATLPPAFTYGNAYPLPADFIRPYELPEDGRTPWEIMNLTGLGPCIVSDAGPALELVYVFDLKDTVQMEPLLVMAFAYGLAAELAIPLAHDIQIKQTVEAEREGRLSIARHTSAVAALPREWDVDILLRARR